MALEQDNIILSVADLILKYKTKHLFYVEKFEEQNVSKHCKFTTTTTTKKKIIIIIILKT